MFSKKTFLVIVLIITITGVLLLNSKNPFVETHKTVNALYYGGITNGGDSVNTTKISPSIINDYSNYFICTSNGAVWNLGGTVNPEKRDIGYFNSSGVNYTIACYGGQWNRIEGYAISVGTTPSLLSKDYINATSTTTIPIITTNMVLQ